MRQRLLAGEIECQHGRHPGGIVPCGRHDRRLNVQRVALTGLENGLYGTCGLGLQLNQFSAATSPDLIFAASNDRHF